MYPDYSDPHLLTLAYLIRKAQALPHGPDYIGRVRLHASIARNIGGADGINPGLVTAAARRINRRLARATARRTATAQA